MGFGIFIGVWENKRFRGPNGGFFEHGKEVFEWPRVIPTTVHIKVWQVHPMQAGACARASGDSGDCWVLPRSMEVQMWEQVVHAMMICNHAIS